MRRQDDIKARSQTKYKSKTSKKRRKRQLTSDIDSEFKYAKTPWLCSLKYTGFVVTINFPFIGFLQNMYNRSI
jgi:hypothetical protein